LFVTLSLILLANAPGARAQSAAEGPPSPRHIVRAMSDHLAAQQAFRFHVETNFEIFDQGQKLQFAGAADVEVRRPDKLSIDYRDDLSARRMWYDGSEMTLLDPHAGIYVSTQVPPNIDAALDHVERRYGLVMPLTDLLGEDVYSLIASRAQGASYVGLHDVDGASCHHLAIVGESADLQLWIHAGDRPTPCKVVIDYKLEPGRPAYVAVMMDWESDLQLPDSRFERSLPDDARKLEFLPIEEARR
jgi:hypothetical protein